MIISELIAGIGNQMFEYAHGKALANQLNTSFKLDLSVLHSKKSKREYLLNDFLITASPANWFEISMAKYIFRDSYLEGYFQGEKYFKGAENDLRKEFVLKEPLEKKYSSLVREISESNSVSIQIRRSDYLAKADKYVILDKEYYKNAIGIISQNIISPKFFFFTDDIQWTKENIPEAAYSTFITIEKYKSCDQLIFQSQCKHNIIANSTFSWWAAWLNKNKEKIVITPKKWFNDRTMSNDDLYVPGWMKI